MSSIHRSAVAALLTIVSSLGAQATPAPTPAPSKPAPPTSQRPVYIPYAAHDLAKIVEVGGEEGKRTATVHGDALGVLVDDLSRHARNYPVAFAKKSEQELAKREAEQVGAMLAIVLGEAQPKEDVVMLLLAAKLEACAHNLDVKAAAQRAQGYFERILKAAPEHVEAHLHFGMHLLGLPGRAKEALPHLQFAHEHGDPVAQRGLGMAHLMLGDRAVALRCLEEWLAKNEGDVSTARLIEALKSGAEISTQKQPPQEGDGKPAPKGAAPKTSGRK